MKILILFAMFFLHIVDDYYLQGILGQLKQKKWWHENYPNAKYRHDWLIALLEHAFSWSFMIMLPIACYMVHTSEITETFYVTAFLINMGVHAVTDHAKANQLKINLTVDQCIHIIQIMVTWCVFCNKF